MTKLLLSFFSYALNLFQVQNKPYKKSQNQNALMGFKKPVKWLTVLSILFISGQTFAQTDEVDTWFRAGKGINSPTDGILFADPNPAPPADGTPVNIWYDIVYNSQQNAVPHPLPANYSLDPLAPPPNHGFDYNLPNSGVTYPLFLTPAGSIPGLPTFRRNSTDNINFNPVVQFDGSGNGQALHFKMVNRENLTVFIVFKARGAGNSAETQKLLFGGDVQIQHGSFNVENWKTNLSFGISDGNTLSVGRTWRGDDGPGGPPYYQSGTIDLQAEPAIGTLVRSATLGSETLTAYANGILEFSNIRNHLLAGNELFEFYRLGKHFNSNDPNRNLTGDIAEVLVADLALGTLEREKVESYLAIKYGITLNAGGPLGSINGNDGYNYIAADGTVIWQVDPVYKHDIAGIGKDKYHDNANAGTIDLRYNQDQRISKSANSDAIVTISTNNDFSTDNLDLSRTDVDDFSFYSYRHNYLIWGNNDATINEIDSELPLNITKRLGREWRVQAVRSAGTNQITNVSVRVDLSGSDILTNACDLQLLIDTDTDGDFTTGPITRISATSVDGADNVYFDNVTFNHLEVFTIGYEQEAPILDPIDSVTACDSYELPMISGTNLTGNQAYYDASGGPSGGGTKYLPGDIITSSIDLYAYDETGGAPNCSDEESFKVDINASPAVPAITVTPES
ncbi:hypothetical protein K1F50_03260, partial [Muricauda oceani]|nr:hypothetical protein [Allomuricauda oceani]